MNNVLEHRLARLFGMDAGLAAELLAAARNRDDGRLWLRITAFLAATTRASRLMPRSLRERAIRAFVWWLFESSLHDPRVVLAYAGHAEQVAPSSCPGLLPS